MNPLLPLFLFPCLSISSVEGATLLYHLDFDSTTIPNASTSGSQSGVSNNAVVHDGLAAPGSTGALKSPCGSSVKMADAQNGLTDGSFMMSFWVNLEQTNTTQAILASGRLPDNNNQARKFYFEDNRFYFGVHGDGSMTHASDITVEFGQWANIAVYYDSTVGTYGQFQFALNGQVIGSPIDVKGSKAVMVFDDGIHLGMTPIPGTNNAGRQYLGANTMLDEFKIYSVDKNAGDDFASMAYNEFLTGGASISETSTATLGLLGLATLLGHRKRH